MIIGSGLIATAFRKFSQTDDICIFASGVSNSMCTKKDEFEREKMLLVKTLERNQSVSSFIYFSTCSVEDPDSINTPYIKHKLEMESIVLGHLKSLIFRLPQVIGIGGNPNTLINFLCHSVKFGEDFVLWKNSSRNVIDVDDVVSIASFYIGNIIERQRIINIANPASHMIAEIVTTIEKVLKKNGVYRVVEKGAAYNIDISEISSIIKETNVSFDEHYLEKIIKKYFI